MAKYVMEFETDDLFQWICGHHDSCDSCPMRDIFYIAGCISFFDSHKHEIMNELNIREVTRYENPEDS